MLDAGADRPAPYPRAAYELSRTPVENVRRAPGFGEANDYVFCELLGVSAAQMAGLEAASIITRTPVAT
jgi:crotonobetainyl-CoA:carnitine CoA-transferase CaiB-like acyl-CoA transferase